MLDICTELLRSNTLPTQWTKVATILIHNKGDPSLPGNFKPITLEPVSLKVLTSLLRNRVFAYLIHFSPVSHFYTPWKRQFIKSHHQKGFMLGKSGTFEHIAEVSHIVNHSRKQQRSVTITLIDLKNAFEEVHQCFTL